MILKGSRTSCLDRSALINPMEPKRVDLPFPQLTHHLLDQESNSLDKTGMDSTLACLYWWHQQ